MGKSKDLATGETRFVNTAGDTMTVNLQSTEFVANNAGNNTNIRVQNTASGSGSSDGFVIQNATNSKVYLWNYENSDVLFGTNSIERLKIDASGRVTMPSQPSFAAGVSANNWSTSSAADAPFDTEIFDTGNNYNTSTYTFTAPVSGRYFASIVFNRYTDSRFDIAFNVNGTNRQGAEIRTQHSSNSWKIEDFQTILNLAANDTVKARITGVDSQGSAFFDGNGTYYDVFSMHLLG